LSKYVSLNDGDMILSGTGGGIDKVVVGDNIETSMYQKGELLMQMTTPVI
jgi:2-keto-4-pentenoate hydratase/2-oxohepta-3-ene-1,7-dioic acid hydratase in catechol pathway